ncbi:hypothetical protein QCM77_06870 [Bradyrhizobium sp. SSUT18]|uniref:hypothetical protein n=1 Tax=Bradyrhizobium sp. SSUT18 TaxID=3040602 RepID=UPI0024469266|nr:hypothetical protein [Bradyrhizobium sp. SSUT18]MDH2399668.1 hypothetical protein [Bradyrhizobium sp. SSUT18]
MDHRNWLGQLAPDHSVILTKIVTAMADFASLSDHFILRMYEFIRHEVLSVASTRLATRQRADGLLQEITAEVFSTNRSIGLSTTTGADHR